jgi:hypothetical protein
MSDVPERLRETAVDALRGSGSEAPRSAAPRMTRSWRRPGSQLTTQA